MVKILTSIGIEGQINFSPVLIIEISHINNHNAELQRTDPGRKVTGEFSTRGRIFPQNAQNGFSLFLSF